MLVALAAACLLAATAPVAGAAMAPGDSDLSPRLAELARPAVSALPEAEQAERLSLAASGPGSLLRRGNRVLAEVRFEPGAAVDAAALRQAGAEVIDVSGRYQSVTVAAKPADLTAIGAVAGVGGVTEVLTPIVRATGCPSGVATSEGDAQLNAASARTAFAVDGSGVTVGILSDSFDQDAGAPSHAAADVASGDLPGAGNPCGYTGPVNQLEAEQDPSEATDEGRAMAQIVHDLAPGSPLAFASAFNGEPAFAANIERLAAPTAVGGAGAKVIADDVAYFEEPFFQDGPVAVAADNVAAAGASYFSAAGNDNLIDKEGHNIASWEAPAFRSAGGCPAALVTAAETEQCMDFNPGGGVDPTFGITVSKGATLTVDLQWAEPWHGVKTDLDAFLLDAAGKPLETENEKGEKFLVGAAENNIASQKPVEIFQWENETGASAEVQLAINHCFGIDCNEDASSTATPRLKFALLENGSGVTETEYPQSAGGDTVGPTVFGHAGAAGVIGVGAVPYNNGAELERYSSRGPVTHYFGPVTGSSPAAALAIPQTISKPDLVATDGGANTFFGRLQAGIWRFYGTSAAAPHAAAVAALVRQANPGASAAQVRADLMATARPVGAFGINDVGAGLVDADAEVSALALPPTVKITKAPPALSRNRRPTIEFSANRPVTFSCAFDGREPQTCASPFTIPTSLADGHHAIIVTGVDQAGRSGSSGVASFTVDNKAPRTSFAKHPRKLIRTHRHKVRESFRFRSNESGVTFVCKVDRNLLHYCRPRISRRFGIGKHTVTVRASDGAGNIDRSPAVFHFTVKRVG
ncbi:MAG TPA: S8 family serine peptidase [Solirubrobacterales bacterium]|nr:S8 family serine peptidase [Solirubrobacterales bacterium]